MSPSLIALAVLAPLALATAARAQDEEPVGAEAPGPAAALAADPTAAVAAELPAAEEGRKLDIYGFADFNLVHMLVGSDNPWRWAYLAPTTLAVGNLNVYLDAAIAERWRSLIEVRFMYVPHGAATLMPDGRYEVTDTTVRDPAELGRYIRWGGIFVERAWVEYQLHERLTIRLGQFLTPYGIWNVDHGSPVIVGIRRPYIVQDRLFPEQQTGVELHGTAWLGAVRLGYHLTVSNGRGPIDQYMDLDGKPGLGGRLFAQWRGPVDLKLGISGYGGLYTDRTFRFVQDGASLRREDTLKQQYEEWAFAADLRVTWRELLVQSELLLNERAYSDGGRPSPVPGRYIPDGRRWGTYLLVGYRTPLLGIMPYLTGEYYRPANPGSLSHFTGPLPTIAVGYAGINVRPLPDVVLKIEYYHVTYPGSPEGSWGRWNWHGIQGQVSWAF